MSGLFAWFNDLVAWFNGLEEHWRQAAVLTVRITVILALAWVLHSAATRLIRVFRSYMARRGDSDNARRIETLSRAFRHAAAVVIALIAGMLVLGELGISIAPILATAGVAGVAIGFGAQSLIRDYLSGFYLLVEDQIRQGDVVRVADLEGQVEEVTLRYVRLRDFEGHVHFVPNGEIKTVTNRTRDHAMALIEVGVAYRENAGEALAVMREVGEAMRKDPQWSGRISGETEIVGVERWDDSAVILRCRLRIVPPIEQWNARREFLKRLKEAFDARGIEIPYPHLTVYAGQAKDGSAPALHIRTLPGDKGG